MVELAGLYVEFGWFEVEGDFYGEPRFYKLRIIRNFVEHLAIGELNV